MPYISGKANGTTQARDRRNGTYAHALETVCVCGHRAGQHTAAQVAGDRPCTVCDCEAVVVRACKCNTTTQVHEYRTCARAR